ncbi:MAG TPA: type II secretion system protein [Bacteroidia bacterium]|nr:type II secretion system protein [Bacteroidia bacterium]
MNQISKYPNKQIIRSYVIKEFVGKWKRIQFAMKIVKNGKLLLKNQGFTLPELLIVMTVLAALATVMMTSYPASTKRARDTRRRSDIKQYQTAIEVYANKAGSYPVFSGNPSSSGFCNTYLNMSNCPDDPKTEHYAVNSSASQYILSAKLERPKDVLKPFFVVCSSGRSGEAAAASGPCP